MEELMSAVVGSTCLTLVIGILVMIAVAKFLGKDNYVKTDFDDD
mgnify:CR=1 FL=1